jgi:hypothetical protein
MIGKSFYYQTNKEEESYIKLKEDLLLIIIEWVVSQAREIT